MNLTKGEQELLNSMYHVILDAEISPLERRLFTTTKSEVEFGHDFSTELTGLLKELNYINNSPQVEAFKKEAKEKGFAVS